MKLFVRGKEVKIIWEDKDYQVHPDLAAIDVETLPPEARKVVSRLPIVDLICYGRGYVLPDGLYLFPGGQEITRVITYDYPEEEKEGDG